jgi:phage antirepressor YoqD-like protein
MHNTPTGLPTLSERVQTMDSREIAELTGKRHDHVLRDIDAMLEARGDAPRFGAVYRDAKGEERRCYRLPGHELMLLLTGYSVPLRDKVLRRWEELERKAIPTVSALPDFTDPVAAARAWADEVEAKQLAEGRVADLAPRAAVADRIADATGLRTLSEVGKINGIGPRRIFELLESRGIIFRGRSSWLPKQEHVDAGRFVVREKTYQDMYDEDHLATQLYVTGKGEVWLAKQFFPAPAGAL